MSRKMAEEVLPRLRQRYAGRGQEGRSRLIDEVCEQWGYSRKHAIKLLGAKAGWGGDPAARKGRPPTYGELESEVLWRIWKALNGVKWGLKWGQASHFNKTCLMMLRLPPFDGPCQEPCVTNIPARFTT